MDTVFLICAVLGGALIVCQLLAGLAGFGGDHDTDHDTASDHDHDHAKDGGHAGSWFLGLLSVRTVTAAVTFFGLGGKVALAAGADELPALGIALGSGAAALYIVAQLMRALSRLKADGTAR